jgi:chaperone modulatory protein CbpM
MNRREFLAAAGLEETTLEVWVEQSWIIPRKNGSAIVFSEIDVARARLICELRHDMGANDAGIDIILHLMDQLHDVRRALADARALGVMVDPAEKPDATKRK